MTIAITHTFVSAKGDGTDATLVRPSNWNAVHTTSMATGKLIGRQSAGTGAFEEITLSAYMASLLAAADAPTLSGLLGLFTTGDVKWTFNQTAPAGWLAVTAVGTIGDASSSATLRANADCQALFTMLYALSDTIAPVPGGRGANAAADWAAHKQITIPQLVGRAPIGAGSAGSGTSARTLGFQLGEENHTLGASEIPSLSGTTDGAHTSSASFWVNSANGQLGNSSIFSYTNSTAINNSPNGGVQIAMTVAIPSLSVTVNTSGGGNSHNNMQPSVALIAMVKL
jgi:microcystin-dependent protein